MEVIRNLYIKDWVRIPVKFVISWIALKISYDYYSYRVAYAMRGANPRSLSFDLQSPVVPHLPEPYTHYRNYKEFMQIKAYNDVSNRIVKAWCEEIDKRFVFSDQPCRENVNSIDRLFMRAKQHTSAQVSQFYFLSDLAKKQGSMPSGVFQEIRKNRQQQVQVEQILVPKL